MVVAARAARRPRLDLLARHAPAARASRRRCSAIPTCSILDEPANGLDPAGIREIRELVRQLAERAGDRGLRLEPPALRGRADVRPGLDHPSRAHARVRARARAARPGSRETGCSCARGPRRVAAERLSRASAPPRSRRPAAAATSSARGSSRRAYRMPFATLVGAGRRRLLASSGPASSLEDAFLADHGRGDRMRFAGLVENEILKISRQRRFRVVVLILIALIGLIVFAQARGRDRFLGGKDWRVRDPGADGEHPELAPRRAHAGLVAEVGALRARTPAVPPRARHRPGRDLRASLHARVRQRVELPAAAAARDRLRVRHRLRGVPAGHDQDPPHAAGGPRSASSRPSSPR